MQIEEKSTSKDLLSLPITIVRQQKAFNGKYALA